MAYAAQSDLLVRMTIAQLVQLTDDEKTGQVNQAVLTEALNWASGRIEGYTRNRYQVPLQSSEELTSICCDLTIYSLYSRRPQKMSETVESRYQDAMEMLRDISSGKVQLDQPSTAAAPQTPTGSAVKPMHQDLRFTEHHLKGYV